MLLETSGEKPEILLDILQCPEQYPTVPSPTDASWPQMVEAPKLRNLGGKARYLVTCDLIKSTY